LPARLHRFSQINDIRRASVKSLRVFHLVSRAMRAMNHDDPPSPIINAGDYQAPKKV